MGGSLDEILARGKQKKEQVSSVFNIIRVSIRVFPLAQDASPGQLKAATLSELFSHMFVWEAKDFFAPMAVSTGFGLVFSTVCFYLVLDDVIQLRFKNLAFPRMSRLSRSAS